MPLTPKGKKIKANMQKEYGAAKGERVFYASANKGTIKGVHGKKKGGKSLHHDIEARKKGIEGY